VETKIIKDGSGDGKSGSTNKPDTGSNNNSGK